MTKPFLIPFLLLLLCRFTAGSQTIEFVENKGQWDSRVRYAGRVEGGVFYVEQDGFTVLQHNPEDWTQISNALHARKDGGVATQRLATAGLTLRSHAYKVHFLGGAGKPEIVADKAVPSLTNFIIGNDPANWATGCRTFQGVTVKNIYPNIDIRYYSGPGSVKYDLIVHPGGNPASIALKYDGAEGLEVRGKELRIKTSVGELKELDPYTYQYNQAGRVAVNARYSVKNNVVRFDVKDYDPKTTLVIDPDLIFCSFSGSTVDNWGYTATYGPNGEMFGGGIVFGSGFPVSPGASQTTFGGGTTSTIGPGFDVGIIKLSADGKQRIYATYIGGGGNEFPQSLIADEQGRLVIAGRTTSTNFPTTGTQGLYGPGGGFDIFVAKLSADGSALIGSKRVGGSGEDGANINDYTGSSATSLFYNYGDHARSEVNLDGAGNIYLASCTRSANFYTLNAVQSTSGGKQDGVLLKFDPNVSTPLFSTYLGGSEDDAAYVVSIHPLNGNIYVAGGTASGNLPGPTAGTIGPASAGNIDGFVSVLPGNGGALLRTSYVGTSGIDQVYGLKFDEKGFPYIMGQTTGNWPVINAIWRQANGKQFIGKLQPDLSAYVYSTVFGKGQAVPDISPVAFLVDRCENVYISGWGGSLGRSMPNAGVIGLTVTPDALKSNADPGPSGIGEDFYFFVLQKDATAQLYGSFFGQNNATLGDHVDGGTSRFDADGVIYQAICASCNSTGPFPTFPSDVWRPTKPQQANCNLAMVKIAFNFAGARGKVRSSINGVPRDTVGCVPLTVDFTDTIQEAPRYEWNFGDGSPQVTTTQPSITHTYNNVGSFRVMMVAIDSTKCFPRDTSYTTIKVGDNRATPALRPVKLSPPCDTFRYRFDNLTVAPPGIPFRSASFTWDFGDGSARVTTGSGPVFHTYARQGTYVVKLTLNDDQYCNAPETTVDTIFVAANVRALINTPSRGCVPYTALFRNESVGGAQFFWQFGDGNTSTAVSPTHTYTNPGTYVVRLRAVDSNTCNIVDSTSFTVTVFPIPTAGFSASPQPPQPNTPIVFTNLSSADAVRFKWVFGDGDSLLTNSRNNVQHEFNLTQTYTTCLTATNAAGCEARFCSPVQNLVDPAVDVPNAFTPQSGDVNSKVFVRGFGIARMRFTIYARWGEKVFETEDRRIGWDGRFKGQLLPMDAYAYTLEGELVDGTKFRKTGDITLIR